MPDATPNPEARACLPIFRTPATDRVLYTADLNELLQPPFAVIPLQVLAYQETVPRAWEVDKPRNLAKAVTME